MPRPAPERPTVLLVNADAPSLRRIEAQLSDDGHEVTAVSSFESAKALLTSVGVDLLVADVRLEAFNGLHLAARSRVEDPGRPVIITHGSYDPVLEAEARHLGASYIVKPFENPEFLPQVRAALASVAASKRPPANRSPIITHQ